MSQKPRSFCVWVLDKLNQFHEQIPVFAEKIPHKKYNIDKIPYFTHWGESFFYHFPGEMSLDVGSEGGEMNLDEMEEEN